MAINLAPEFGDDATDLYYFCWSIIGTKPIYNPYLLENLATKSR